MKAAWEELIRLTNANAVHRKGWRLAEITAEQELKDAAGEMVELAGAPDDIEELVDVMACLIEYAIKKGWTIDRVERAMLYKLGQRFSVEEATR